MDLYLRTSFQVDYGVCHHCQLVQQVPIPQDVGPFYPDYPMHRTRKAIYDWARKLMHGQIYFIPPRDSPSSALLDFGCGEGAYLRTIRSIIRHRMGFEPNPGLADMVSARLRVPVYSDLRRLIAEHAASLDYVTAHFVFEHLTDLRSAFRCVSSVLKPGGVLHIAAPNIRSGEARLFGRKWHGLDAPRHISFPDAVSLGILAAECGLELKQVRSAMFPNTIAASLVTVLTGRYHHTLFLAMVPFGLLGAWMAPAGARVFVMQKKD